MPLGGEVTVKRLAERESVTTSWVTRVVRLAFLSPAVLEAIMTGTRRADLDAAPLIARCRNNLRGLSKFELLERRGRLRRPGAITPELLTTILC